MPLTIPEATAFGKNATSYQATTTDTLERLNEALLSPLFLLSNESKTPLTKFKHSVNGQGHLNDFELEDIRSEYEGAGWTVVKIENVGNPLQERTSCVWTLTIEADL